MSAEALIEPPALEPEWLAPPCPDCPGETLELTQPHELQPEIVFGCCYSCGAIWSIADESAIADQAAGPVLSPPRWRPAGRIRVEAATPAA